MQEMNKDTKSQPEKQGDQRGNLGGSLGTETGKGAGRAQRARLRGADLMAGRGNHGGSVSRR